MGLNHHAALNARLYSTAFAIGAGLISSSCARYLDTTGASSVPQASQICIGQTIQGVVGTAICNGVMTTVSDSSTASSTTATTATFTPSTGTVYSVFTVDLGTGYQASNICSARSIFGLTGTAACPVLASNNNRDITSTLISQSAEISTAISGLPTGYRNNADSLADDEGGYKVGYCGSTIKTQADCSAAGGTFRWVGALCVDPAYTTSATCAAAGGTHIWVSSGSGCTTQTGAGGDSGTCSTSYPISSTTHNAFVDCGGSGFANVTLAMKDCLSKNGIQATWIGSLAGGHGEGSWAMVAHRGGLGSNQEVWQDQRTGLIWSSKASGGTATDYWCRAAGNTQTPLAGSYCTPGGGALCGGGPCQLALAQSYCAEQTGLYPGSNFTGDLPTTSVWETTGRTYDNAKGAMGLQSTPKVYWRLPTKNDYIMAEIDGIRFVMPDMGVGGNTEWTASIYSSRNSVWNFYGNSGRIDIIARTTPSIVRCVGRVQ